MFGRRVAALFLAGLAAGTAHAADGERIEVTGEMIDTWCYFSGVMGGPDAVVGTAHHTCALWCAAGGIPVGLLADDGSVYMVMQWQGDPEVVGADSMLKVQSHRLEASGTHFRRDGIDYLFVGEVVADEGITRLTHEDYGVVPPFAIPEGEVMRAALAPVALALALAAPAAAQDFAADSEAKEWGLFGERKARFAATVTDVACVLTADCPDDCGAGARPMTLIRETDGAMVLALKNGQPAFSGAIFDLAPFCGRRVEVDGVLIGEPGITPAAEGAPLYMVQRIRLMDGDWQSADRFTKVWAERNPDAGEGEWFRNDPRVRARIEAEGYLGLGPEADAAFIEENR